MPDPNSKSKRRPKSCLLESLSTHLLSSSLHHAVDLLPVLARSGLRAPLPLLARLLSFCLHSNALPLARRVHLHLRLTTSLHSHTLLANHVLAFHFACRRPDHARKLFDKMLSSTRNVFTYNAMLAGYSDLRMPAAAKRIFEAMPVRDVVSWNTVIIAFARAGMGQNAVRFFVRMGREFQGRCNSYTFSGVLMACVQLGRLALACQLHRQCFGLGFLSNAVVLGSLLDVYVKCGSIEDARKLFDETSVRDVHTWTTLVSGYAKCGEVVVARELFDQMPERNAVSWSAMISGYVRCGFSVEALELFARMTSVGVVPDQFVVSSGLSACAGFASVRYGQQIHAYLVRSYFRPNVVALSALVDMYAKSGDLVAGWRIFNHTPYQMRDTILWNTMISAFGQHGHGILALKLFSEMTRAGVTVNSNTFVVILTACSHSGLLQEGLSIFKSMTEEYNVIPDEEHHACFVDLLGRAGLLQDAKDWISKLPSQSSASVWKALLGACRIHGNVELGSEAAERLVELEPKLPASYVLLSNMYTEKGKWESAERVRRLMEERRVKKEQALSSFEVNNSVHSFGVYDSLHPSIEDVRATSEQLSCHAEDEVSIY